MNETTFTRGQALSLTQYIQYLQSANLAGYERLAFDLVCEYNTLLKKVKNNNDLLVIFAVEAFTARKLIVFDSSGNIIKPYSLIGTDDYLLLSNDICMAVRKGYGFLDEFVGYEPHYYQIRAEMLIGFAVYYQSKFFDGIATIGDFVETLQRNGYNIFYAPHIVEKFYPESLFPQNNPCIS